MCKVSKKFDFQIKYLKIKLMCTNNMQSLVFAKLIHIVISLLKTTGKNNCCN